MWTLMESPVGELRITEREGSVAAIEFTPFREPRADRPAGERHDDCPVLVETVRQLRSYFAGEATGFDLPLAPHGTEFQQRVWKELLEIPHGQTRSYGEIEPSVSWPTMM